MSKQNKDRLSRRDWIRHDPASKAKTSGRSGAGNSPEDWEERALRGRELLSSETEAEELLGELDQAIGQRFDPSTAVLPPGGRRQRRRWGIAAACALVLMTAAWWLFFGLPDREALYEAYFSHLDNELSVNLMGEPETNALSTSLRAYNARRYAEAVQSLAQYLDTHEAPSELRLYYGISLMENDQTEEAIAQLQLLKATATDGQVPAPTDWYLSLAYLKAGRMGQARALLNTIAGTSNPYAERAEELLRAF